MNKFPIGEIRKMLSVNWMSPWNTYVRDKTAEMELEWVRRFQLLEKKDCCPHGIEARLIYPCTECTAKLNNQPPPTPIRCKQCGDLDPECPLPANSPEIEAKIEDISELICHWFSNGPVGTPNPDSLSILLRELVKLAREGK